MKKTYILVLAALLLVTAFAASTACLTVPASAQMLADSSFSMKVHEKLERLREARQASSSRMPASSSRMPASSSRMPASSSRVAAPGAGPSSPDGVQAVTAPLPQAPSLSAANHVRRPVYVQASTCENILNVINTGERFSVVIDPGHGGKPENGGRNGGDHWDPFSNTFLLPYNFGASGGGLKEHQWTLSTARKVRQILSLTATDEGFQKFSGIIRKYIKEPVATLKRVRIDCSLTREYSYDSDPEAADPDVNRKYRLFDSPVSAATAFLIPGKTAMGRISFINQQSPDLVVCIHNNSSPSRSARGMSAVIVPHFSFFSNINTASLEGSGGVKKARKNINYSQIQAIVAGSFARLANVNAKTIISDTATYFTGFRAFTNKFIGLRYLMVTWRYNTSSLLSSFVFFFMRENSVFEYYKRAAGPEGYGGDNFYSSQEIIRFVRTALVDSIAAGQPVALKNAPSNADDIVGKHGDPFVSDWAIPLYVNAITAYVELGYVSNPKDRKMLVEYQDAIAEGVAAGIYSLCAGLQTGRGGNGAEPPKGKPVDFSKYGRSGASKGYFNISRDPLSF